MVSKTKANKKTFLFKYDLSATTLKQLIKDSKLKDVLKNTFDPKGDSLLQAFGEKLNGKSLSPWGWVRYFFTGEKDCDKMAENEIIDVLKNTEYDNKVKLQIYNIITSEPPTTSTPQIEQVSVIFNYFLFFIVSAMVIYATRTSAKICNVISLVYGIEPPGEFAVIIGFIFQMVAAVAFISAGALIFIRNMQFKNNDVSSRDRRFREKFLLTIPNQIMNLGLITMIFAVVGVIFFKEKHLLDFVYYINPFIRWIGFEFSPSGINTLQLLLIAGGLTEAAAFYLGYRFPEKMKTDEDLYRTEMISNNQVSGPQEQLPSEVISKAVSEGVKNALDNLTITINSKDK